jgi:hypothetical protein
MTMDPFEEQLKNALRREPPRAGFAGRVKARVAVRDKRPRRASWSSLLRLRLQWVLAILVCVGMLAGVSYRHDKVERARGEAAKQQVYVALRLAGAKIELAESKLRNF